MMQENYQNLRNEFLKSKLTTTAWLKTWQDEHFAQFLKQGWPHTQLEAWKYSKVQSLAELPVQLAQTEKPNLDCFVRFATGCHLVFLNGEFWAEVSDALPEGIEFSATAEAAPFDVKNFEKQFSRFNADALMQLQEGFLSRGAFIKVRAKANIAQPLHLVHVQNVKATQALPTTFLRQMIFVEESAQISITQTQVSLHSAKAFTKSATDFLLQPHAQVFFDEAQVGANDTSVIENLRVVVNANAQFHNAHFSCGHVLGRHDVEVHLQGDAAGCQLLALSPVLHGLNIDHNTVVEHWYENTTTEQIYKSIVADQAQASFSGLIHVHKTAQKTAAKQLNQNILISEKSVANARPQLRIEADDVKCSHGATVGQINAESLFYLQSRGIPKKQALSMLILGFAEDILSRFNNAEIRDRLHTSLQNRFFEEIL